MVGYNLTARQKELLRKLVEYEREGRLEQPLRFVLGPGIQLTDGGVLEAEGNLHGDLAALYEADLLGLTYGSRGQRLYDIGQAGHDAVDKDFELPLFPAESQVSIGSVGVIVLEMSGGSIQAAGVADNAKLTQIVNDPALLQSQLEDLTAKLLDEVKSTLTGTDLIEYVQSTQDFKEQLSADEPNPALLKRLASKLALLADIEGTIGLVVRVWPYLYPLLLIATERLGQ